MKTILIMPAIDDHVSVIKLAKEKGYRVITCDNIPSNAGHEYADLSYDIDLFDYDNLVAMAKKESVDVAWGYATDIGALAAAKVSDALNLGGNSFDVVNTMCDKSLFREFLQINGFNCPAFSIVSVFEELVDITLPVIVKPIDRASSKGVSIVTERAFLSSAFKTAKDYSISSKVIVEEYISTDKYQLHGDAIVLNGDVVYLEIGDQFFSTETNSFAPIGTVLPSSESQSNLTTLKTDVQRFVSSIGFKDGAINVEARIDLHGQVYIVELGPRSGGNYIPELLSLSSGINLQEVVFSAVVGSDECEIYLDRLNYVYQFIWRSEYDGVLQEKVISDELNILEYYEFKFNGDIVSSKAGADNIVAILMIKGESRIQVEEVFSNPERYFTLKVEGML